jgi:short-subunit dehydrogenase
MDLSRKTIVITGASKGLGRMAAINLSKGKAQVILVARTKPLLERVREEIEEMTGKAPLVIACDISDENDVNRMAGVIRESFQRVDVLINNAGIGTHKTLETMSNGEMRKQFEVNFFGTFYCIKALLPLIRLSGSGYILNVGSLMSEISFADNSVYAATKFALSGFVEGFRYEMKKSDIKVGFLLPGLMDTSFQDDREGGLKVPGFLILHPQKVAITLERMISRRTNKAYMYRWMLWLMKMRRLLGR